MGRVPTLHQVWRKACSTHSIISCHPYTTFKTATIMPIYR